MAACLRCCAVPTKARSAFRRRPNVRLWRLAHLSGSAPYESRDCNFTIGDVVIDMIGAEMPAGFI